MVNNEIMRKRVRALKAFQHITFREIAEYLEIKDNSFYLWLNNHYNFGSSKLRKLDDILNNLTE